jgi:hypothetical protein
MDSYSSFLKKYIILFLVLFTVHIQPALPKKTWTFLVYMAADNQISKEADASIEQMKKIGSRENVSFLVYLNTKREGQTKITQKLIIRQGSVEKMNEINAQDSGSETTLINALQWAMTEFPSDYFALCIWDRGSRLQEKQMGSMRGICYDATTSNFISDAKYRHALDTAVNQFHGGKKINVLLFDSCLMADIAVAYAVEPYVQYLVSSQEVMPATSCFDYTTIFTELIKKSCEPKQFAQAIVGAFDIQYMSTQEKYALSALDLSQIPTVVTSLDEISESLTQLLFSDIVKPIRHAIIKSGLNTFHFAQPSARDLFMLCENLDRGMRKLIFTYKLDDSRLQALRELLINTMRAAGNSVCGVARSKGYYACRGISIYFPNLESGIVPCCYDLCWSKEHPQWLELMRTLIQTDNVELDVLENSFYARNK